MSEDTTVLEDQTKQLRFNTEEERLATITAMPDSPPDDVKDVEAWEAEQSAKLDSIQNATIGEVDETTESDEQSKTVTNETVAKPENEYDPKNWTLGKEDIPTDPEFTFTNVKDLAKDVVNSERYIKTLKAENANFQSEKERIKQEYERELAEARKEVKPVIETSKETTVTDTSIVAPTDEEITNIQKELTDVDTKIDSDYGDELDDPEALKLQRKASILRDKLYAAKTQKLEAQLKDRDIKHNEYLKQQEKLTADKKMETEKQLQIAEENKKQELKKIELEKAINNIESFRKDPANAKDFSSPKSYTQMNAEYCDFASEVAAAHTGNRKDEIPGWGAIAEEAMARYLSKTPELLLKVQQRGVKEPTGMRDFLVLSEVDMIRQGFKLNKVLGKWEKKAEYRFPDFDSAYTYYLKQNGLDGKPILDAREAERNKILNAMDNKGATEIPDGVGAQEGEVNPLSKVDANAIIAKYEEASLAEIGRRNPNAPQIIEYNKALVALGYDPIDPERDF